MDDEELRMLNDYFFQRAYGWRLYGDYLGFANDC